MLLVVRVSVLDNNRAYLQKCAEANGLQAAPECGSETKHTHVTVQIKEAESPHTRIS